MLTPAKWKPLYLAAAWTLALVAGCGQPAAPSQTAGAVADAGPPIEIGAYELWREYGKNAVAADEKYKGRRVKVRGDVRAVEPAGDTYCVSIQVMAGYNWPASVLCYLDRAVVSKAAGIETGPGNPCAVTGTCQGFKKDRRAYSEYVVILDDCVPVEDATTWEEVDARRKKLK